MVEIKLSKVSKLDGIYSFSLQAGETCKGSIDPKTGSICPACSGCYAKGGTYHYANTKNVRKVNFANSKKSGWTQAMIQELDMHRYFRWFDSGDMYSVEFAEKVLEVIKATPWVRHWLPTRTWTIPEFSDVLKELNKLPQVVVRYSSGSITGETIEAQNGSTVIGENHISKLQKDIVVCGAYLNKDKKCKGCRKCWDKNVKQVAYIAHGQKGTKMAREAL